MGEADDGIVADAGDAFRRHVAGALDGPFVVLLEQDGTDQSAYGRLVGKDAHDLGPALHLAVDALEWVCAVQLGAVLGREFAPVCQRRQTVRWTV